MKSIYSILTLLLAFVGVTTAKAQENTISIPNLTVAAGNTISMPVVVTNSTDIVAVQFNITVPDGININTSTTSLTERCSDHAITLRETDSHQYMAMIYSPTNTPISGSNGTIMTMELSASNNVEEGSVHPLILTDVVLAQRDGSNMVTGFSAGNITIDSKPDLQISDITTSSISAMPGDQMTVSWKVSNVSSKSATSGWKTDIFLESGSTSKLVTSNWQEDVLDEGASVSSSIDFILPAILGLDGNTTIKVQITSTDESVGVQDNNTAYSTSTISIGKRLYINHSTLQATEKDAKSYMYKLSRSGNNSVAETFTLTTSADDNRLELDKTISIPAGKSEVYFYINVTPNGIVDDNNKVTLTISGNDYEGVESVIDIEDDVFPDAIIAFDKYEINEGEEFNITASAYRQVSEDTPVTITCDTPTGFLIPSGIIIPAGKESVSVKITSKDDNQPDLNREVGFTVTIPNHNKTTDYLTVIDNDMPTLSLSLTPNAVSEDAGPLSVTATISRTSNIDKKITIQLSDNSDGQIYYGRQKFDMEAGIEKAVVTLGPIGNNAVDGERTVEITAAVYVAACSCAASDMTAGGIVKAPLTIYDNDGPALEMSANPSVIKEGGETTINVKRNTSTENALNVSIESDHADRFEFPSTIVIPAGETETSFVVKSNVNDINDDGVNVMFTASADGYAKGFTWFTVTDQTLPDAKITSVSASATEVIAGEGISLEINITNDGTYELPAGMPVTIYANNPQSKIATAITEKAIACGETITLELPVSIPNRVGDISIYAVVNENQTIKELVYTNNTSGVITIVAKSPYSITLSTDKEIYLPEETVMITGKLSGTKTAGEKVEIYAINNGYRHTMTATSDAEGNFSCEYIPYNGQTGHFIIGACYPGENLETELATIDIFGFKRLDNTVIAFDVIRNEPYSTSLKFVNTGELAQTNVSASALNIPDGCSVKITGVESSEDGKTYVANFEVTAGRLSEGREYEKFTLHVTSDEGGSLDTDIYFYCIAKEGQLSANISRISTTVTKGSPREYPFTITNTGQGETGKITLSLPDWMNTATPKEMASLNQDESAEVVLRINTEENMPLNMAVTGPIGINCANAKGLAIPFEIIPVSEISGTLTVDVCDENTYYSPNGAHLSGASVKVTHPYTGAVVAEGTTGEDGKFDVEISGGYYTLNVSAEGHDSFQKTIMVDPGKENPVTVNLSINGIDIDCTVVPTEIEDEYEIVTTVKFQVDVPVPVVELIVPQKLDADKLAEGESIIFNAVLVNHGLVTAEDVQLKLPENTDRYEFEALSHNSPFTLAANQSVQIPIRLTRRIGSGNTSPSSPCTINIGTLYYWDCGLDRKWREYYIPIKVGPCPEPPSGGGYVSGGGGSGYVSGGSGGGWGGLHGGSGGGGTYHNSNVPSVTDNDTDCDPCQSKFRYKMTRCFVEKMPIISEVLDHVGNANCVSTTSETGKKVACLIQGMSVLKRVTEWVEIYEECLVPMFVDCNGDTTVVSSVNIDKEWFGQRLPDAKNIKGYPSYIQVYLMKLSPLFNSINAMYEMLSEIVDDTDWYSVAEEELISLAQHIKDWDGNYESLLPYKPSTITDEQFRKFTDRISNFNDDNDNKIDSDLIDRCYKEIADVIDLSVKNGYGSLPEMLDSETTQVAAGLNEAQNSVCSTLTLQFSQRLVMTRQAFRGTLKVNNRHETLPIENMTLILSVSDTEGNIATSHEFQIAPESLTGFKGNLNLEDGWELGPKEQGIATVLFIPTKYAAPTEPKDYNFTGFVTYLDPFTGTEVVRELNPVTLTVSPSPNLDMTYFMQRDVIGNDPLTEVVEPCEEAEFSLLIHNTGYGDATDVRMTTNQPEIVQNDKGVPIDLELISSQLNGNDKDLALGGSVATNFGFIPSKTTTYAQWWFRSSLLGHFVDYDVKATHVTSYGNPDLSLLGNVTIHELIRSLKVGNTDDNLIGFLTNDLVDAEDTPDMLYVSTGDILPVSAPKSASIEKISSKECRLTVNSDGNGWVYGNLSDPTYGRAHIKSVVRQSDGNSISTRNFWLTDRTLRDGRPPLYEHRIHFADNMANATETYILEFDSIPELQLAVVSIEGVPLEGTVASKPVESVNVMFNKHIDPATFTTDDLSLTTQGEPRDVSLIDISTEDNKTFKLDFSALNDTIINGYYVLTVQTADITDEEGYNGKYGKSVNWVMYFNNKTCLKINVDPVDAGEIQVSKVSEDNEARTPLFSTTGAAIQYIAYGTSINLKSRPDTGYRFIGWYIDDECISTDSIFTQNMVNDLSLTAKFEGMKLSLIIDDKIDGGKISGASSGVYIHGDSIRLTAQPDEDYLFGKWIINGNKTDSNPELEFELTENTEISASFIRDIYNQTFSIYEGWNWISSYLNEPIGASDFNMHANRILGQFSESILDPSLGIVGDVESFEPGYSYKLQSNTSFLKTISGHLHNLSETPIELHKGWNWISYPYYETRSLNTVFTNPSEGDVISSQTGFAEYSDGSWQGSMESLTPGEGYLYKSVQDKVIDFLFSNEENLDDVYTTRDAVHSEITEAIDIHKYPDTMNMTLMLVAGNDHVDASDFNIYAMSGNECRGVSVADNYLHYLTIHGEAPTEISLIVENKSTGETFVGSETLTFRNDVAGNRKNPYIVRFNDISEVSLISGNFHKMKIFTTSGILIDEDADVSTIKSLTPGIYIIDGKKVLVK